MYFQSQNRFSFAFLVFFLEEGSSYFQKKTTVFSLIKLPNFGGISIGIRPHVFPVENRQSLVFPHFDPSSIIKNIIKDHVTVKEITQRKIFFNNFFQFTNAMTANIQIKKTGVVTKKNTTLRGMRREVWRGVRGRLRGGDGGGTHRAAGPSAGLCGKKNTDLFKSENCLNFAVTLRSSLNLDLLSFLNLMVKMG